jgi:hypothetical protein
MRRGGWRRREKENERRREDKTGGNEKREGDYRGRRRGEMKPNSAKRLG